MASISNIVKGVFRGQSPSNLVGRPVQPSGLMQAQNPQALFAQKPQQATQQQMPVAQQQPAAITTPSGMPVTGNPATYAGTPETTPIRGLVKPEPNRNIDYASLVRGLVDTARDTSSLDRARTELEDIRKGISGEVAGERSRPIELGFQQGREQVIRQRGAELESAAARRLESEMSARGQTLSALGQAAGFTPEALRYGGTGQFDPSQTAQQYAQDVVSGARTYADAVSSMGLYGNAGRQFLDQAIRTANPNFNFAQAQSFADTQGKVGPQYQFAQEALANVENALQSLGGAQKTNVPLWNQFANFASLQSGVGGEQTRQFVGAVQSLRNAYAAILASAKGGLPSDYSSQAIAEVPDIPTPNDLAAIRHNLETLGQSRIGIFGTPGNTQVGGNVINTTIGPVNTDW